MGLLGRGHGGQSQQDLDVCELPVLDVPGLLVGEDIPGASVGFRAGWGVGDTGRHVVPSRGGFLDDLALQIDDLPSGDQGLWEIPQLHQPGGTTCQRHNQAGAEKHAEFSGEPTMNPYDFSFHIQRARVISHIPQAGGEIGQGKNQALAR